MKRLLAVILSCALIFAFAKLSGIDLPHFKEAHAQSTCIGCGVWGMEKKSGGGAYAGPGDLTLSGTVVAWWGWRCYSTSYTGNVADVVDAATGNTTGTRLVCNSGGTISALVSASACTFVTGNACSALATTCAVACNIVTMYDQSGQTACSGPSACNITQATNGNRPSYTATGGAGGKACMQFASGALLQAGSSFPATAQPITMSMVAERTGNTGANGGIISESGSFTGTYYASSANGIQLYAGSLTSAVTATDSAFHAIQAIFDGSGSSTIVVDGSGSGAGTGVNPGTAGLGGDHPTIGVNAGDNLVGVVCEAGIWNTNWTSANNLTMNTNQHGSSGYNF